MKEQDKVFSPKVDESLYSRQLYVIGSEAMKRMLRSSVLVLGLKKSGLELVKNLALAGVKAISVHDPSLVAPEDLSTLYYCTESDIGDRVDKSIEYKLKELNSQVSIHVLETAPQDVSAYTAVVMNDFPLEDQVQMDEACRKLGIPFVAVRTKGLFFQVFCDFGDSFVTTDTNGEAPYIGTIKAVSPTGEVTLVEEERHSLEDADEISVKNRKYTVRDAKAFTFSLEGYAGESLSGETFEQIKKKSVVRFKALREAMESPIIHSEFAGSDILHRCFLLYDGLREAPVEAAVAAYLQKYPINEEDVHIVREFFRQPDTSICPITSISGGISAHEVLKACSGKFTPLQQFMYYHALEALPPSMYKKKTERVQTTKNRYSAVVEIFGEGADAIFNAGVFVVGAGAIGCEHMKNLVMLGMGKTGRVALTDMDAIERSNLNRQFLFREHDISQMKSAVAAREAAALNPSARESPVMAYVSKVGKETESLFNDEFYGRVDVILNALDNVEARLYIDSRAIYHKVAVIDSGTLGSKGHTQVVVPGVTEHYGSTNDPQEKSIPLCTIRNFPYQPVHCVEWALADFKSLFYERLVEAKKALGEASTVELPDSAVVLLHTRPKTPSEALKYAIDLFVERFTAGPLRLCESFPKDHMTEEGTPFWIPPKRMPSPVELSLENQDHRKYVESAYHLVIRTFALESLPFEDALKAYTEKNTLPRGEAGSAEIRDKEIEAMRRDLAGEELQSISLQEEEFEKDSETNGHIAYITAASNIRSTVYGIQTLDALEIKRIAGRIIPAIATTTAVVSGLALVEAIKFLLWKETGIAQYRNTFVSLALSLLMASEPVAPHREKITLPGGVLEVSPWDMLEVKDEPLEEILQRLKRLWGVEIHTVMSGLTVLFCTFYNKQKFMENLKKRPSEIIYPSGIPQGVQSVRIDPVVEDDEGNDLPVPFVKVLLK
ncbi:ubiquitin-activating enzyme E1 [Nematocida major]|uniref:ubiquitin-activating enzyme E1 n=1 Tax=Nematocida major TaxID=1912982 RepID=UPI00200721F4|nr:ubiquitin-activating enzyme E1 [Nematocida major]KAH9386567.1 ubiquitin-activating enzyme E1 [Nematocida major]